MRISWLKQAIILLLHHVSQIWMRQLAAPSHLFQHGHVLPLLLSRETDKTPIVAVWPNNFVCHTSNNLCIDAVAGVKLSDRVVEVCDSFIFGRDGLVNLNNLTWGLKALKHLLNVRWTPRIAHLRRNTAAQGQNIGPTDSVWFFNLVVLEEVDQVSLVRLQGLLGCKLVNSKLFHNLKDVDFLT